MSNGTRVYVTQVPGGSSEPYGEAHIKIIYGGDQEQTASLVLPVPTPKANDELEDGRLAYAVHLAVLVEVLQEAIREPKRIHIGQAPQ